jgi:hypothetical protein
VIIWLPKNQGINENQVSLQQISYEVKRIEGSVKRKNGRATGAGPVFGRSGVERESLEPKFARAPGESQT